MCILAHLAHKQLEAKLARIQGKQAPGNPTQENQNNFSGPNENQVLVEAKVSKDHNKRKDVA